MYKSHLFCALRCYQSKLSPAIIEVFVHILKFSPAKKHKETFPLSRFLVTKSAAKVSKQDSRRPPSKPYPVSATPTNALRALVNSRGVYELVARAMRGKCVRQIAERKPIVSHSPQSQLYHACEHITRGSRADSCTHCPPTHKYGRQRRPYLHFSVLLF